ncbi:MAG: hypothetical protein AB7U07_20400 [Thermoleophilia bacterium]
MSDVPTDPAPPDDESALGLGWLFDDGEPGEEDGNSAIWPTEAVDMLPLPGFTLDEDSVLVPLPPAENDQAPETERPRIGVDASRAPGGRIRVALRSRAGAGAGVLGGMIIVAAATAGIGLPGGGDTDGGTPAPSAADAPALVVDTSWTADVAHTVKAAERRRQRLLDAAETRTAARRAETRKKRSQRSAAHNTPSPAPAPVASTPVETASPPSDPWAGVPGSVREFEPGPWNNGGATS